MILATQDTTAVRKVSITGDTPAGPSATINVGMGEIQVTNDASVVLTSLGLGSCIAMCAHDPVSKVGALAHLVLPASGHAGGGEKQPTKYVDTGVPFLVKEIVKQGAIRSRLVVKIAGGAKMLAVPGLNSQLNIGERNIEAVEAALTKEGIRIAAANVGGTSGRSVQFFPHSGKIFVKTVGGQGVEL